jgi:hypothetical protein
MRWLLANTAGGQGERAQTGRGKDAQIQADQRAVLTSVSGASGESCGAFPHLRRPRGLMWHGSKCSRSRELSSSWVCPTEEVIGRSLITVDER